MSEPKRYGLCQEERYCFVYVPHPEGEFVRYEDYARLRERVERLTKAGNWMFNSIILNSDKDIGNGMTAWLAAKEGKPHA